MACTHVQHTLILLRKQANAKVGRGVWAQFRALGFCRYVWFHSGQKHKHAHSVRMWKAINVSWFSSVYIYPEFISDLQPVSGSITFQKVKAGLSSSSSPLLSTVCFSICQCEMNYAIYFFVFYLLLFLTCGFILLSVALFVQWHIKKKERCFFYVTEQKNKTICVKSRVEFWNIRLAENMLYFLPCQSDMQNLINFQRFFLF